MDIDRAREIQDNAAIDALVDRLPSSALFLLADQVEPYNARTWHMDCADFLISDNAESNDHLRQLLGRALYWLEAMNNTNRRPVDHLTRSDALQNALTAIGTRVLLHAMENNLTVENIGEYHAAITG